MDQRQAARMPDNESWITAGFHRSRHSAGIPRPRWQASIPGPISASALWAAVSGDFAQGGNRRGHPASLERSKRHRTARSVVASERHADDEPELIRDRVGPPSPAPIHNRFHISGRAMRGMICFSSARCSRC